MRALGESWIGQSVVEWWKNYAACYECPPYDSYDGTTPEQFHNANSAWMSLRHKSFVAVVELTKSIQRCSKIEALGDALKEAARADVTLQIGLKFL